MKKRLFLWFVAVCMLLALAVPAGATEAEPELVEITWQTNGGKLKAHHESWESSWESEAAWITLKAGESLSDAGYIFDSIEYFKEREFLGWEIQYWQEVYDGDILVAYNLVRLEGTDIMDTEALMAFKIPSGKGELIFSAIWAGDDSNYYTAFNFDPLFGTLHYFFPSGGEDYTEGTLCYSEKELDMTLEEAMYKSGSVITEAIWEGHVFEGWVMYHMRNNQCYLASTELFTTEQVLSMKLPHDDLLFLAKWDTIDLNDCVSIYEDRARGTYSFFPEGAEATQMTLDQSAAAAGSAIDCFAFTAPESGTYGISTDVPLAFNCNVAPYYRELHPNDVFLVDLLQGQTLKFYTDSGVVANFRVEKVDAITGLRVISQDEDFRVLKSDHLECQFLLEGVVVEATFSSGAVKQYALSYSEDTIENREVLIHYTLGSDGVYVTLSCDGLEATYTVKTYDATIVKFEVLFGEDQFLYENYGGSFYWTEDFQSRFHYDILNLIQGATYRFTWSDGTVEEVPYSSKGYYGGQIHGDFNGQFENPWTVGENALNVYFCDLTAEATVTVKENPVASVTLIDVPTTVYLGDPYYFWETDGGYELYNFLNLKTAVQVTYADGTVQNYLLDDIDNGENGPEINGYPVDIYWYGYEFVFNSPGEAYAYVDYLGRNGMIKITVLSPKDLNGWMKLNDQWAYLEDGVFVTEKWVKDGSKWCYIGEQGRMIVDGWALDGEKWCYLDKYGYRVTNKWVWDHWGWAYIGADGYQVFNEWAKDGSKWCYLGADGYMVTDQWVKDGTKWAYVGADGYMVKNQWVKDGSYWCYLDKTGHMVTNGWAKDGSLWRWMNASGYITYSQWIHDGYGWCYINSKGAMETNKWVKDGAYWAYVGADGYMVKNQWVKDGSYWCYIGKTGHMVTNGWAKDGGLWRWMNSSGYITYSKWIHDGYGWCYINSKGAMETTEWVKDGKYWAYIAKDGYMATNKWIDNGSTWSYVDANGHALTGTHYIDGKKYTFDANGNLPK